jgi:cytochrome P450
MASPSDDPVAAFDLAALPEGFIDDPYPLLAGLRERSPRHRLRDGGVFLTRHADAVEVYRSPAASSDKKIEFLPKYGRTPLFDHHTTSLVFNDPPLHTRVRRLLMGAVNQRAINRMQASLQALIDELLEQMAARGRVDLIADFAAAIPIEVIGNLLAVPRAEREPLRDWSLAILGALEPVLDDAAAERGNRAVTDFSEYLRGLIAERRRNPLDPEEDVLTRLIQGEGGVGNDYRLSEFELIHQCIFLLNAGHETTTNLIGNGTWLLMRHPDQMQRLREDPSLINPAVEEMLRYEGPIQLNNRRLTAALELDGETLKSGTPITICIGAANRDPREFADPERFDVARRPNRHLAFGHGDHACVGMNVARLEGRLAIGGLLARFASVEPDGEPVRDMRVRFRGFTSLPVRLR